MAGPRTFDEDILFQDELDFDQFPDEKDKNPKDSKSLYEIALDIISGNKSFMRRTFYVQNIEGHSFQSGVPYQGELSTSTEFWMNKPGPRKQELPMQLEDGSYTYYYIDPQERPQVYFHRVMTLELNTGEAVRFAVFGSTQIPDTINAYDQISNSDLERYMNATDSPFVFAGVDSEHMANLTGFDLGMKEDFNVDQSLSDVLWQMGLGSIAKVDMTAEEQYKFMVEFIEAHPALDGWLTENIKGHKTEHDDEGKAVEATHGSRNSLVTELDRVYSAQILGVDDMAEIADQLRRRQKNPNAEGPLKNGEEVISVTYQGQSISPSQLMELFYKSVDVAVMDPEGEKLANVLVFEVEGGYFARERLTKDEAHKHWLTLDSVDSPEDLRDWDVKDKFGIKYYGKFKFLDAQGTREVHRLGESYYRGRRVFKSNRKKLNQSIGNDPNDGNIEGFAELTAQKDDAGDYLFWYIRGEIDRPATHATYFRSILNTDGTKFMFMGSFQSDLGKWIYDEVNGYAKEFAKEKIGAVASFLSELSMSREALEAQLGALPDLEKQTRKDIITAFGFEEDALDDLVEIFSSKQKASEIILGLDVDGYNIDKILERISESSSEIWKFHDQIDRGAVDALAIEEDFGDMIREYAYKKAGFNRLDHTDFPHDDQASSSYTMSTAFDYTNTREQLYAYYVYNTETWKMVLTIIVVVIVAVVIALATMGVGLFVAGAVGATGFGAVVVTGAVAGVLFTIVTEVIMQAMGQGTLNRDKDAYGIWEFLGQMVLNAVMFIAFGAVGEIFGSIAAAAKIAGASTKMLAVIQIGRISTMAVLFTAYGLGAFYAEHGRLPEGREWKEFWLENILALVLFEVGGLVAKGGLMKMKSAGNSVYAKRMTGKFQSAIANVRASQKSVAKIAAGKEQSVNSQTDITKTYIERIKTLEELLAKYQKKVNGTDWKIENENGEPLTKKGAKQMEADLMVLRLALERSLLIKATGLEKVVGSKNTMSYNGTKEGANLIQRTHKKQGDKVLKPDDTGRIEVHLKDGGIVEYIPDSQISSEGLQKILLENADFGGSLRQISKNVMGVDQNKIPSLSKEFESGTWTEIREGELYYGEMEVNGEKTSLFFMVEEKLNIATDAWRSEQKEGGGLSIIRNQLRSPEAVEGYNDYVENQWKYLDESSKVKEIWKLEQKGKSDGEHLNQIFERRSTELNKAKEEAKAEFEGLGSEWIKENPFTGELMFNSESGGFVVTHKQHNNEYPHEFSMGEAFAADGKKVYLLSEKAAKGVVTPDAEIVGEGVWDFKNISPNASKKNISKNIHDYTLNAKRQAENIAFNLKDNPHVTPEMVNQGVEDAYLTNLNSGSDGLADKVGVVYKDGTTKIIRIEEFASFDGERF